jgi:hypothetical protein
MYFSHIFFININNNNNKNMCSCMFKRYIIFLKTELKKIHIIQFVKNLLPLKKNFLSSNYYKYSVVGQFSIFVMKRRNLQFQER